MMENLCSHRVVFVFRLRRSGESDEFVPKREYTNFTLRTRTRGVYIPLCSRNSEHLRSCLIYEGSIPELFMSTHEPASTRMYQRPRRVSFEYSFPRNHDSKCAWRTENRRHSGQKRLTAVILTARAVPWKSNVLWRDTINLAGKFVLQSISKIFTENENLVPRDRITCFTRELVSDLSDFVATTKAERGMRNFEHPSVN